MIKTWFSAPAHKILPVEGDTLLTPNKKPQVSITYTKCTHEFTIQENPWYKTVYLKK